MYRLMDLASGLFWNYEQKKWVDWDQATRVPGNDDERSFIGRPAPTDEMDDQRFLLEHDGHRMKMIGEGISIQENLDVKRFEDFAAKNNILYLEAAELAGLYFWSRDHPTYSVALQSTSATTKNDEFFNLALAQLGRPPSGKQASKEWNCRLEILMADFRRTQEEKARELLGSFGITEFVEAIEGILVVREDQALLLKLSKDNVVGLPGLRRKIEALGISDKVLRLSGKAETYPEICGPLTA